MTVGPPPPGDPWAALGLPGTATVAEAERAYRRLAKHHHPDAAGDDPARRADAEQRMVELNAAIAAVRAGSPAAAAGPGPEKTRTRSGGQKRTRTTPLIMFSRTAP